MVVLGAAGVAEAGAAFVPDRADSVDIARRARRRRARLAPPQIHAEFVTQCRESRVHLCGDAARPGASRRIGGPQPAMPLREILDDRQRIPDHPVVIVQAWDAARWRNGTNPRRRIRQEQRDHALLEFDPCRAHQNPRTQRPGRVVLVADIERIHPFRYQNRWNRSADESRFAILDPHPPLQRHRLTRVHDVVGIERAFD